MAAVSTAPHYGLESADGKQITPARFTRLTDLGNGFWCAEENGKSGVIDQTGAWVVQPKYNSILQYRDGKVVASEYAMVTYNYEQAHFIGRNGMDAPQYNVKKLPPFEKTLEVAIDRGQLFGYRLQGGDYVIAPQFTNAHPFYPVY